LRLGRLRKSSAGGNMRIFFEWAPTKMFFLEKGISIFEQEGSSFLSREVSYRIVYE